MANVGVPWFAHSPWTIPKASLRCALRLPPGAREGYGVGGGETRSTPLRSAQGDAQGRRFAKNVQRFMWRSG